MPLLDCIVHLSLLGVFFFGIVMGYVKLNRCEQTEELMKKPNEFMLLTLIAYRARRTLDPDDGLEIGEALVGDYKACGLTERKYRTAKKHLKATGKVTFKATNKGTVAKLINSDIYDINTEESDGQSDRPSATKKKLKNSSPKKKSKVFENNSNQYRLSELLFTLIEKNNPNTRIPNLQTWSGDIDKLIRINGRTSEQIETVIIWCQKDSFWHTNILSASKLREQFDQLWLKMGNKQPPKKAYISHKKMFEPAE